MDAAVREGLDALEDLADDWRALWESDPSATPFHAPEYARAWKIAFGQGRRAAMIEMRRDGDLAGLATFVLDPDGVLRFLADADITDYLGPVAALADRDEVASHVVSGALELDGWTVAELQGLAADSGWPEALARAAKAAGLVVDERPHDVCPRVSLQGGWEGYLQALDGKLRHEIRRKARRFERDAGTFTVRLSRRSTIDHDLERFFAMHRSSEGPKGRFLHWGMEGMFKLVARFFDERGWLRLAWLDVEGEPVAGAFGFSARGTWSVYNSAYDHRRREWGPGMVLMGETIRLAAEEGCTTVDFLRGEEPYKYRLGAADVPLVQLTLRRD